MPRQPHTPIPELSQREAAEFWGHVDVRGDNECWEWTAAISAHGHTSFGSYWIEARVFKAHRVAWAITHGDPGELMVGHLCANVHACVNPGHMFLGDEEEIVANKIKHGRQSHGVERPDAKLSVADVIAIRADTRPQQVIAAAYGLNVGGISMIMRRGTWKSVPGVQIRQANRGRKLTDEQVRVLRSGHPGKSRRQLALEYGVDPVVAHLAAHRKTYKDVI